MTCRHCEEYRLRIAELEDELRDKSSSDRIAALRYAHGLTENEAFVLLSCYDSHGRPVSNYWLYANRPRIVEHRNPLGYDNLNDVKVMIHRVRAKTDPNVIATVYGSGYAITPEGRELVKKALGE